MSLPKYDCAAAWMSEGLCFDPHLWQEIFFSSPTCPDRLWNHGYEHFSAHS